ncbi:DUF4389 domain-containing protein [Candidatus Margulisiibacteriota bacterium]
MTNQIDKSFSCLKFSIAHPKKSNRLTVFFRLFYAIPIVFVLLLVTGFNDNCLAFAGILFLPCLLAILFRKKYPKWWFDWNFAITKFSLRVSSYLLLLRDEYPSFDEDQSVNLELKYPNAAAELSRGMPLVKWFLAIPHYVILIFLHISVILLTIIAWFSILFTGKYPAKIHEFVVGVIRWSLRVCAYAFMLITDEYPPFSLSE